MVLLSDNFIVNALLFFTGAIVLFYFLVLKRTYTYWERNGFKTLPGANVFFGHFQETIFRKEYVGSLVKKLYDSSSEPFIGIYSILRPVLLVRDPDLIRSILITDFSHFTDRGIYCHEESDPLSGNIFAAPGQKWRNLRSKLSPAFTFGKMKAIFSTLQNCGSSLEKHLNELSENKKLLNAKEIAACFLTNVTASVIFGIDCDAITNPNNDFRVCGREIFSSNVINVIRQILFFNAPKLMQTIGMKVAPSNVETFIRSMARQNLEHRVKNVVNRKDIFHLLIQIRNTGKIQEDGDWDMIKGNKKALTFDEICAQTFIFFIGGFETSSVTISFCLYELAKNVDVQQRVHNEIDATVQRHGGELTYEALSEMKYLDACLDETLRKYPPLPLINRSCVKDYTIPGTNNVITKGTQVYIPALGLHMDSKYYSDPNKFYPDRFNEENSADKSFVNRPFLAFGEGPRNCIGISLGKLQTKIGLVMMLNKFRFELADQHENKEMKFDPKFFITSPLDGVHLQVFKR